MLYHVSSGLFRQGQDVSLVKVMSDNFMLGHFTSSYIRLLQYR